MPGRSALGEALIMAMAGLRAQGMEGPRAAGRNAAPGYLPNFPLCHLFVPAVYHCSILRPSRKKPCEH